jgi:hypothetical protein
MTKLAGRVKIFGQAATAVRLDSGTSPPYRARFASGPAPR